MFTTTSSYHVTSDVAGCLANWGGSLVVKSGNATSDVGDFGLAHVVDAQVGAARRSADARFLKGRISLISTETSL